MVKTVLVTGATGKQGGSAIKELLTRIQNFKIKALVRNPDSAASQKLKAQGVELIKGDLHDQDSLKAALKDVDSAFLMTTPIGGKNGALDEIVQGKNFIDAAKVTGVKFIVFTSVGSADRDTKVPHFDSKREVEKYLESSGIAWTILRPVAFMDNFPTEGITKNLTLSFFAAMLQGKQLQLIAVEDIGIFAGKALEDEEKYKGRHIELAGDDVNAPQILEEFERVQGSKPFTFWMPLTLLSYILPVDINAMFAFFREKGYVADIAALRMEHPGLKNFEQYLRASTKDKAQ